MEPGDASDSLQLSELLHKFFNAEPRKLYRNLCIFPVTFAFEDNSFSIFRVSNALAAAKTGFARTARQLELADVETSDRGMQKIARCCRSNRPPGCRTSFFVRWLSCRAYFAGADLRLHSSNADRLRYRVRCDGIVGRVDCAAYPPQVLAGTGALRSSIKWPGISPRKRDGVENSGESLP